MCCSPIITSCFFYILSCGVEFSLRVQVCYFRKVDITRKSLVFQRMDHTLSPLASIVKESAEQGDKSHDCRTYPVAFIAPVFPTGCPKVGHHRSRSWTRWSASGVEWKVLSVRSPSFAVLLCCCAAYRPMRFFQSFVRSFFFDASWRGVYLSKQITLLLCCCLPQEG